VPEGGAARLLEELDFIKKTVDDDVGDVRDIWCPSNKYEYKETPVGKSETSRLKAGRMSKPKARTKLIKVPFSISEE
jgi:hypothetical protein